VNPTQVYSATLSGVNVAYLSAQEVTTDGIDVTADWTVPLDVGHFGR
jgi:hypothetical protein